MSLSAFKHFQSAHCENGVTVNLLKHNGVNFITEPLAFGIGSGLFYIHIPFLKVNNGPAVSFRTFPGAIFKRSCKALQIKVESNTFRSTDKAMDELDRHLDSGIPVGCQVGVFHLSYFPKEYRFHFNAHNIIVFGKDADGYLISDPIMENTVRLSYHELKKVRFAQGVLAPRGRMYFPVIHKHPSASCLKLAITKGIKRNCRDMLHIPGNIAGVSGILYTAKKIKFWREKLGEKKAALYLGQIVRMQEEIGTGGGGFRFLYGAFLEEASEILQNKELLKISELITSSGDLWRDSALQMSGIYKNRINSQADYNHCATILTEISKIEKEAFTRLSKINFKLS